MFPTKDPGEGKYVGNVFGPFWTKVAIILIGGLSLLFVVRHWYLGIPFDLGDPNPEEMHRPNQTAVDSMMTIE
ncbi:MAG: hypothetical protein AAF433_04230 [Bacteroidota bacterium]